VYRSSLRRDSAMDAASPGVLGWRPETWARKSRPTSPCGGPRMNPSLDDGSPPRPLRRFRVAEHGTQDLKSSRAPVHSVLVQKSVTTSTNVAGRLSISDARRELGDAQEGSHKIVGRVFAERTNAGDERRVTKECGSEGKSRTLQAPGAKAPLSKNAHSARLEAAPLQGGRLQRSITAVDYSGRLYK